MIRLIGTAHISEESVREVEEEILSSKPDIVAVELCPARYRGLIHGAEMPLMDLIKGRNSAVFLANTVLSLFQRKLGEEVGVNPGKEMLSAIEAAKCIGVPFAFIDRDVGITLSRAMKKTSIFEKLRLFREVLGGLTLSGEDIESEINEMKNENHIDEILEGIKVVSPSVYETLVRERDAYMAKKLLELNREHEDIVAVVGAGHKRGIEHYLQNPKELPSLDSLVEIPRGRLSPSKAIKFGIPALILLTFVLAFYRGVSLGHPIKLWFLYNAIPTFLAVLLVGGSLVSAIVGMLASPLTSLNPLIAAGWFAGAAEIAVRKVTVGDVKEMFKTTSYRELYRNRAFKVLLVTAFANIGSSLGTFISIPQVVLPLMKRVWGA